MSRAHAPNGLLVDPIYAKMRCRPLCVSPPPVPVYAPPEPPQTFVNQPPRAPSAYRPDGSLVQDGLSPDHMITGTDGAIDVFLQVLVGDQAPCALDEIDLGPPVGIAAEVSLNVPTNEMDSLSIVAGVAMFSYADRIQTHYQPYLNVPEGIAYLLKDRSGEAQHYDWIEEGATGTAREITTNTVNGPNGTTSQTRIGGSREAVEGRWAIGALYNDTDWDTTPHPTAMLNVSITGWDDFDLTDGTGVMGTGPTNVNGQILTINGPIPEDMHEGMTAYLSNTCGDQIEFPLSYDAETDTLTGTIPTSDPSYRFLELGPGGVQR